MKNFLLLILLTTVGFWLQAQTLVSTEPQNKNVVLEEYTGIHCQYCPDGHKIAQGIADANPGRVVLINVHQGSFAVPSGSEPDFRTPFGDPLAAQTGLTGYPSGTVNRHVFAGSSSTALNRGSWSGAADQIMAMPSPVNVGIESSFNPDTRELTVNVELYYTATSAVTSNFINVALLQDSVLGPQTGGGMGSNYVHMHILRYFLTGQWGDEVTTTTQGTLVNRTYVYTIPASYNNVPCVPEDCRVAVYVAQSHQEVLTGDMVDAIGGTNRFIGTAAVAADFKQGTASLPCDFTCQVEGALTSGEQYEFTFAPVDVIPGWTDYFTIDGVQYTGSAVVALNQNEAKNIQLTVVPGDTPEVATYRMTMKSVAYPGAPAKIADVSVISGITTLVVNGSGGPETTDHESAYLEGLAFAGCTTYTSIPASQLVKAVNNGALVDVNSIFYNVAWTFPAFKDSEAEAVKAILNSGRNVLVAGQDIGWDIMSGASGSNGNAITQDLYTNYLCAKFIDDGGTTNNQITAVLYDEIYGAAGNSTVVDVYAGNMYPDQIDTLSPARPIFLYKNLNTKRAALRVEKNGYKAAYFGIGFEMMSTTAVRNQITKLTYDWFNEVISGVQYEEALAKLMGQNYPNPANMETVLPLNDLKKEMVVKVMDMNGKVVSIIPVSSGTQSLHVNTNDLPAGQYICTLCDGKKIIETRRITVAH
ncbi:MAG: Omp28-related outer membrane protein [Bacteroidales bacterium]|nr:Omp28-related outer membrane protein [Bacteroidales bacterium]